MTERRFADHWERRRHIGQAKARYKEWCNSRAPVGAPRADWDKWHDWRQARINYFNEEVNNSWRNQQFK